MNTVLVSTTLFLTIVLSLAFGIAAGYAAIMAVLRAFAHSRERVRSAPATLVSASSASSGD